MARKKDLQSLFEEIGDAYKELKLLFMDAEDVLEMSRYDFYGDNEYRDEFTKFVKSQSRFVSSMAAYSAAVEELLERGTLDTKISRINKDIAQTAKRAFK